MKKLLLLLSLITVNTVAIWASETQENDSIYGFTSERATYSGGEAAMIQELAEHLDLPNGLATDFTGRTMIKAVVEKDGTLSNLQIARSCSRADVDSAVLKAAAYLSEYSPAKNEEEIVRSYIYIPASFPRIFALIPQEEPQQQVAIDNQVYMMAETMPMFPGGQQALFNYLSKNVHYPEEAQKKGIEGRAICQFTVNKDGTICDVTVVHSSGDASLDEEAIRVISSMPRWIPGKQDGKPVRVKYTVPINFRLTIEYTIDDNLKNGSYLIHRGKEDNNMKHHHK